MIIRLNRKCDRAVEVTVPHRPLVIYWDAWTRRHQARARWFRQRARLKRDYALAS
jgi:hypothetical protein